MAGDRAARAEIAGAGFRQLHAWWRIQGTWQFLRGAEHSWGTMTRTGFAAEADAEGA